MLGGVRLTLALRSDAMIYMLMKIRNDDSLAIAVFLSRSLVILRTWHMTERSWTIQSQDIGELGDSTIARASRSCHVLCEGFGIC